MQGAKRGDRWRGCGSSDKTGIFLPQLRLGLYLYADLHGYTCEYRKGSWVCGGIWCCLTRVKGIHTAYCLLVKHSAVLVNMAWNDLRNAYKKSACVLRLPILSILSHVLHSGHRGLLPLDLIELTAELFWWIQPQNVVENIGKLTKLLFKQTNLIYIYIPIIYIPSGYLT